MGAAKATSQSGSGSLIGRLLLKIFIGRPDRDMWRVSSEIPSASPTVAQMSSNVYGLVRTFVP